MAQLKCPTCGRQTRWSQQNPFRPFCSERCKMIDLGAWASDRYSSAGRPTDEGEDPPSEVTNPPSSRSRPRLHRDSLRSGGVRA
jgi:endogenous inhibitor of DNA gyrase (YacG/DUF329 family)